MNQIIFKITLVPLSLRAVLSTFHIKGLGHMLQK